MYISMYSISTLRTTYKWTQCTLCDLNTVDTFQIKREGEPVNHCHECVYGMHVVLNFLSWSLFSFIPMIFPTKVEWQIFSIPLPRHIKVEIFDVLTGDIENRILFIHICESTLGSEISFLDNSSIFRMVERGRILGILAGLLLSALVFVRLFFRFFALGCGIFRRWKVFFFDIIPAATIST